MSEPAIHTRGLSKVFGTVTALAPLDLDVAPGEVLGCLGTNGAGKTTLIRLLLGLLRPTAGRAAIFGADATRDAAQAHRRLAYVPGESSLWPSLTGAQTLHLLGGLHGRIDTSYRDELVGAFELDTSRRVREYSKGNRQKVSLIAALMTRADLLLLDEPTSGLDPVMEEVFRDCVRAARDRGQAVLLSSHILSEVEALCDRVAILRTGRLADLGSLSALRHLAALDVEITVDGPVPELATVPGVSDVTRRGQLLRCRLHGSIEPLLRTLRDTHVIQLLSREPSLEELFLAQYGGTGTGTTELASSDAGR